MSEEQRHPTNRVHFLFDLNCDDHLYYRWRVWSLANGDTMARWYDLPFQMMENGPYWVPPRCRSKNRNNEVLQEQATMGQKKNRSKLRNNTSANRSNSDIVVVKEALPPTKAGMYGSREKPLTARPLSKANRQKFIQDLRQLRPMRKAIRGAMFFCMKNAEMAAEIVEILSEALCTAYPNTEKKLARIYLISDILQNSKISMVKNGAAYTTEFKKCLPQILESLHKLSVHLKNAEKILFDKKVHKLLDIWETGTFFTTHFSETLRNTFRGMKPPPPLHVPIPIPRPPTIPLRKNLIRREKPQPARTLKPRIEKKSAEKERDDVDGAPMDDVDGAPMDDLDGAPMDDAELDGIPMV